MEIDLELHFEFCPAAVFPLLKMPENETELVFAETEKKISLEVAITMKGLKPNLFFLAREIAQYVPKMGCFLKL